MRCLPKEINLKLSENDTTPDLDKMHMVSFVQRHRAVRDLVDPFDHAAAVTDNVPVTNRVINNSDNRESPKTEISQLVALVSDLAAKQRDLEEKLSKLDEQCRIKEHGEPTMRRGEKRRWELARNVSTVDKLGIWQEIVSVYITRGRLDERGSRPRPSVR